MHIEPLLLFLYFLFDIYLLVLPIVGNQLSELGTLFSRLLLGFREVFLPLLNHIFQLFFSFF